MQSGKAPSSLGCLLPNAPASRGEAVNEDLAVGVAHLIAGQLMNLAGPLFWAVLVVGLISAVLGIDLLR